MVSFTPHGEMSERFKEPVLKTGDGVTHRGFESHSLRQKEHHPAGGVLFGFEQGFERTAPVYTLVQKVSSGHFLVRGRIHVHPAVSRGDIDGCT